MKKHLAILTIESGKPSNQKSIDKFYQSLKDGKYTLEAASLSKRSNQANRYYFGLVVQMVQAGIKDLGTELTKEETHEFLKARFNSEELINEETGECVTIPRTTTGLSKESFSEYISKIQQFAAEFLNVVIPDPGLQTAIEYE